MAIVCSRTNLSFIWVRSWLNLLTVGSDVDCRKYLLGVLLGTAQGYKTAFRALQQNDNSKVPPGFGLPWLGKREHHFWTYYLGGSYNPGEAYYCGEAGGNKAWRACTPLRKSLAPDMTVTWSKRKKPLRFEIFYYAFGVGLVATASLDADLELEKVVDHAQEIRHKLLQMQWGANKTTQTLDSIARDLLDQAQIEFLGKDHLPESACTFPESFSICTVIDASGIEASLPIPEGEDLRRPLQGMCLWEGNWHNNKLTDIKNAYLDIRSEGSAPGDVLYASRRGRTVWFPGRFVHPSSNGVKEQPRFSLGCYHRNIVLGSLQIEMLASFLNSLATFRGSHVLSNYPRIPAFLERTVEILTRLRDGTELTYRSGSLRAQIEANDYLKDAETLLKDIK